MVLRNDVLVVKNIEFLSLEIESNLKIVIDCNNKKNNIPSSIVLLIDDI